MSSSSRYLYTVIVFIRDRLSPWPQLLEGLQQSIDPIDGDVVVVTDSDSVTLQLQNSPQPLRVVQPPSRAWLGQDFLQANVHSPLALFIDENTVWEPHTELVKSHLALHQIHSDATLIGGLWTMPTKVSLRQACADLILAEEFDHVHGRGLTAHHLWAGHLSAKTENLRRFFELHPSTSPELLAAQLSRQAHEVLLVPQLTLCYQAPRTLLALSSEAFRRGQVHRLRAQHGLLPKVRHYQAGSAVSHQLQRQPRWRSSVIEWVSRLYDLAYQCGYHRPNDVLDPLRLARLLMNEWLHQARIRLAGWSQKPFFTEMEWALKAIYHEPSEPIAPAPPPEGGARLRRSRYDTIRLR